MLERLLSLLHRYAPIVLLAGLVVFVVAGSSLRCLSLNDSPEHWMPASTIEDWERFATHFEYSDTVAVGLEFHREVVDADLDFVRQFREDLSEVAGIRQVIDVSLVAGEIESVPLTKLLKPPAAGQEDPYAQYRGILFDDPSPAEGATGETSEQADRSSRTLLDYVLLEMATTEGLDQRQRQAELDQRRREVAAGLYAVLEKHRRDDVTFHAVGAILIQHELETIARRLLVTILPLSILLTLCALGVGFRSRASVIIAAVGGAWSVVVLLGGVVLAGWSLNVVTVGGPPLMTVIMIATVVHFSHYYSLCGGDRQSAASGNPAGGCSPEHGRPAHFLAWVAVPCLGAAAITGVGFLMLAFNELRPARELGVELFFGAVLAFFGAFLVWLVVPSFSTASGRMLSVTRLERFQRIVVRRPRVATTLLVALLACLACVAQKVEVDADPFSFFHPDSRIARALDHFTERRFGLHVVDVVLVPRRRPEGRPADDAAVRENHRIAWEFERKIRARPEVHRTISTVSAWRGGPQLRLDSRLLKDIVRRMAYYDTFRDWTSDLAGQGALRVTFLVCDVGAGFRPLVDEVRKALPEDHFDCICTGTATNVVVLSENLVGGMLRGLAVATIVMALLCVVLFRSLRLTLIAVLPNAFPVLTVFGLMGVLGVPLNSGSAMVTTIALGIGLNDTVHFVMHYRRWCSASSSAEEALAHTFSEIGRPIVLTSVVMCLGFAIFLLCDFRPMYHFGLLASVAMVAALVGDLILLPNLLTWPRATPRRLLRARRHP